MNDTNICRLANIKIYVEIHQYQSLLFCWLVEAIKKLNKFSLYTHRNYRNTSSFLDDTAFNFRLFHSLLHMKNSTYFNSCGSKFILFGLSVLFWVLILVNFHLKYTKYVVYCLVKLFIFGKELYVINLVGFLVIFNFEIIG